LPITLGGIGSVYHGPGFGIQMLDVSVALHNGWQRFTGPQTAADDVVPQRVSD
jgi:hypothetical protein